MASQTTAKQQRLKYEIYAVIALCFSLVLCFLMAAPQQVNALYPGMDQGTKADKWVGKGSKAAEQAIAAGKTLLPITTYWLGAGHGGDYKDPKPKQLDCSSFTDWAYRHGAGVQIGPAYGYTTWDVMANKHYKKGTNGIKRGDLLLTHNGGHIVIYLGKDPEHGMTFLGCNGTNAAGGVSICYEYPGMGTIGYVDMESLIKDKDFTAVDADLDSLAKDYNKDGANPDSGTKFGNGMAMPTGPADDSFTVNGYGSLTEKEYLDRTQEISEQLSNQEPTSDFTSEQKKSLNDWEDDYNRQTDVATVSYSHLFFTLLGFGGILYTILLWFAYALDRVGIFEPSFVGMLSFGKWATANPNQEGTYLQEKPSGDIRLLSFKDMSVITSLFIGLFILTSTGVLYTWAYHLYQMIYAVAQFVVKMIG